MKLIDKLHFLHSAWHYRLNTEKDDLRFLMGLRIEGKTVIDIGANRGIYSYWMSKKVGPKGRVIAFEPQPELKTHLLDLKKTFNCHPLEVINKGLSCQSGKKNLFRPEAGSGGASLNRGVHDDWQEVPIELATLDEYMDQFQNVVFIKCDVEGHERDVFKGGERLLRRDMPCLLFECHHDAAKENSLFSFLTGLGYDGFFACGKKMKHYSKFDQFPYRRKNEHHRNYLFINPDFIKANQLENIFERE